MENSSENDGRVYAASLDMGGSSNMELPLNPQQKGKRHSFRSFGNDYFFNNLLTKNPFNFKKMATAKVAWLLAHLLGIPCVIISMFPSLLKFLNIDIGTIKEPYQTIIWILACIYFVGIIGNLYENWHHKHLRNREHEHDLKRRIAHEEKS